MSGSAWQDRILQPDTALERMKQKAALRALEEVRDGMKLGLGTGSTARYFVDGLGGAVICAELISIESWPCRVQAPH